MGSRDKDKDKGVNVQVLLRCRPCNEDEVRNNAPQVISCNDHRREVTVCQNIASKQIDRTFTFDKVFGPQSQQRDLYEQAVVPIVHEVLDGFNCTIFAYGQTGTGKTYTMEGSGRKTKQGGLPDEAGVIPRSVQQIFDTLESQNAEYSVKVTFLELYNEEITDLLAPEEFCKPADDKQRKPLALMEDGKGGVLVRGLEEEIVTSASEIYSLLDRGSAKRRTAETLLNKQSSRSHSIFSITIHIKEATPEGEELIKCGKLNLVDLAGSENISRSGAREGRAREAGEINKSLLTLGRVITALVEHLAHIPYRDSKLTRLLRDSLGGKTKTCIIATVSPSVHCLDETLSTLDYAHRAKNIRNKPEVNQKMMKSALIKDLYGEIEKLKVEVYSAREKNGIYLPRERFLQDEIDKKNMTERIELMECDIEAKDKHIEELQNRVEVQHRDHLELSSTLGVTQVSLQQCQKSLLDANEVIKQARYTNKEQSFVIAAQQKAESRLAAQATELQSELEKSVEELAGLFAKLERKANVEVANNQVVGDFRNLLGKQMQVLHSTVLGSVSAQRQLVLNMEHHLESFLASKDQSVDKLKSKIDGLKSTYLTQAQSLCDVVSTHETVSSTSLHKLNAAVSSHTISLDQLLARHVANAEAVLVDLQSSLSDQQQETALFAELQREAARQSLEMVQSTVRSTLDSISTLHSSAIDFAETLVARSKDHDASLLALQDSYQDQAKYENSQLLDGISELVTHSMSRMFNLMQSRVSTLRETNKSEAMKARKGLLGFQETALSAQEHLNSFLKSAETKAVDTASVLASKACQIQEVLDSCVKYAETAAEHWEQTHKSVQEFERGETPSIVLLITEGLETNQLLTARLQALSSFIESHVEGETQDTFNLLEDTRQSELEGVDRCRAITHAQAEAMDELEMSHGEDSRQLEQITADKFEKDYREDESTGVTPTKRAVNVPDLGAINSLRTPALELLQEEFRLTCNQPEADEAESKQFSGKLRSSLDLAVRTPLVALN